MTPALILAWVLLLSQVCLVSALVLASMRAIRGPRAQDRVTGLDTMYVCAMLLMVVTGMRQGTRIRGIRQARCFTVLRLISIIN